MSRKEYPTLSTLISVSELRKEFEKLEIEVVPPEKVGNAMYIMVMTPSLLEEIQISQREDEEMEEISKLIQKGRAPNFRINDQGIIYCKNRWCVPSSREDLKKKIMEETHNTRFSV